MMRVETMHVGQARHGARCRDGARRWCAALALVLALPSTPLIAQHDPRLLPAPRELVRSEAPRRFETTITFPTLRTEADRSAAREFVETMRERGIRAELGAPARG